MVESNSLKVATSLGVMEEIGQHMPGGFFIYKADEKEELLYVNDAVLKIFGCATLEEFKELTGYTFRGLVYEEDYDTITNSINEQIETNNDKMDCVEYRIVNKDGSIRWIEDYGHYVETDSDGGLYYVFISDITDTKDRRDSATAKYQAFIDSLSTGYSTVWLINDVDSEILSFYRENEAFNGIDELKETYSNVKYSDALHSYVENYVATEDRERVSKELAIENVSKKLEEKPRFSLNYLRKMDDGTERYYCVDIARVDMPGSKMGVVCGFKDVDEEIREMQRVQSALEEGRKAEEDKRLLMDEIQNAAKLADLMGSISSLLSNMPAMSFSKDAETGKYLACNQAFAEYAHKPDPEGVIGLTDYEIFDAETARHFVEDDQKAIAMDEPYLFFEDVPDAKGNMRNLQTTKLKFKDNNGRLCTLGMCVDVTEMSRAKAEEAEARIKKQELEEKLTLHEKLIEQEQSREQQNKLITALASDYWSVYYVELDKDDGICYQAHSDIDNGLKTGDHFCYSDTLQNYAEKYITEQYQEEFLKFVSPQNVKERLLNERVISYRYMIRRHGHELYEMIKFAGVRHPEDRDDHMVHAVGMCFADVDKETRKDLETNQALSDALISAEEASKAKTTFLSNMSHEIRTPMNAIIGLNNIAMNDPETSEKEKEYFIKIDSSAKHLLNIINDILDMSRIEMGRMVIKNEEFSFSRMLEQVNTMISSQCHDKGLYYECHINGDVRDSYIGDDMKLRQVLINILGNAVKFTNPDGRVRMLINNVASFDNKTTLQFVISDTGIGMSEDYLPHIFDTFSQENSATANNLGSTGLGMAITKNIVELMNGTIEVESEKGVGSTFTVTVTLDNVEGAEDSDTDEINPHDMSVLIIDDDPIACEHAKIVLGQIGVSCESVLSGAEAVELVKVHHGRMDDYNLILVDWKMPEMDGIDTTRAIREIVGQDTPIIILTSYNWDDVEEDARNAGVDSFVPKPLFAGNIMEEFKAAFKKKNELLLASKADLKGKRILLAEDVTINAEIMKMLLATRETEVELAENGQVAVDMFTSNEAGYYDAILMDMRMPVMDGLEATRVIRNSGKADAKSIPIIALTANAFDEDVQRSMQAGLNAHLSKPVEPETLFNTLESLIK